ncbi:hypothetical protein ACIGNX_30210 [Actinosynnema sp. NPDC053489]|uniref:hypothetical protein n=1 Tax=Actinosynnema sp. NPDC053489 TaxID=3363916 RepID=UPI0037CB754F
MARPAAPGLGADPRRHRDPGRAAPRVRRRRGGPAYRDHPGAIFDHPVTALEPLGVAEVPRALRRVTSDDVRAIVPADRERAADALGTAVRDVTGDLAELPAGQHAVARDFHEEAADRGLAVVTWWGRGRMKRFTLRGDYRSP